GPTHRAPRVQSIWEAKHVSAREELKSAIKEMLDFPESYLLEIAVKHQDNVFPMVPQGKGVAEIVLS
ncbi:MAG TPA: hypothetical protein DDZ41_06935, partial [Flavobacterium sp.]|nr:hypothetical protein [Flavobacterium sp.]